ncbi:MAG: tetratricopeptide repeat protein [Ignavibacteriae bacterium]|nr:tetratricopeptide repeat protein [Ignavibacteriota bacterium]
MGKTNPLNIFIFSLLIALGSLLVYSQDSKENQEFKLAVGLYNDGMYDLAVEQFKNFINAYPNTSQGIEARFYLGSTQMKLKRYDEARITFQNFALAYVDHLKAPEAWINVGEAFHALDNDREAASAYERVKVFHPKSPLVPEALFKAAELYRHIGERENAKKMLRSIIQDYPTSKSVLPARLAIGEMYAEEGQTELAEREARRVAESDAPLSVRSSALFSIGKLQMATSLFTDAEATFKSLITTYPTTSAAQLAAFELSKLEQRSGKYAAAIEHVKKVASDDGADDSLQAAALFRLGGLYVTMKDYQNAPKSYERLISKFPKSSLATNALLEIGRVASLKSNFREAIGYLKQFLSMTSSGLKRRALLFAAQAALALTQYREAASYYSLAIEDFQEDTHNPMIMLELGKLYKTTQQDCRKAMVVFDQLAQKFPQSRYAIDAMIETGNCLEQLGDIEGALKTYKEIQARYPTHDLYDSLDQDISFLQQYKLKNRDAGIEKLARLMGEVLTQKSKSELAFQLGEIYFNDLKDYTAAAKQFTIALNNSLDADKREETAYLRARSYHLLSEIGSDAHSLALQPYDEFLRQYPNGKWSDNAAFYRYQLASRQKNPADILTLTKDFLTKHQASSHRDLVLWDQANAQRTLGGFLETVSSLKEIMTTFPTSHMIPNVLLQLGNTYLDLNNPDSGALSWQRCSEHAPTSPSTLQALWRLADLRWKEKKYSEAITLWKRITTEFPYSSMAKRAATMLPQAHLANGDYEEAIAIYENHWQEEQSSPFKETKDFEIVYYLANAYEKKGDRQTATKYYNEYLLNTVIDLNIDTGSNVSNAFYALGVLAQKQGNTKSASAYFKQAALHGRAGSATKDIADLLFQSEQYTEAAKQYVALAQSATDVSERQEYQSRAIVATLRMDKLTEAQKLIVDFEKTYGKTKKYRAEFEYEKANVYYRKQDHATAKKVFEKVADDYEGTPFGPWSHYYLAKMSEVGNKLEEAAKKYENILKKFPNSDVISRVNLSLGNMYFNVERFEEAIAYYQRITAEPQKAGDILPYAMNNLIEAYESTKLYDAALKMTRDYLERYPNEEDIIDKKIKIGVLYMKLGYYDQAVLHFQNLLSEVGSLLEAELRYNIGEAYYYKGDYQQAILEFLKVPYVVSKQGRVDWTATSFYMAGQAYEKMSKFDEAIGMYQQIIDRPGIDATFKAAARKEIDRVKSLIKKGSK